MRRAPRLHRAVIGAVLVMAVIVMGGLPALSAGLPSGSMSSVAGMAEMSGLSAGTDSPPPTDIGQEATLVVGCDAMCGDLLHACLAVLTFLVASALALPGVQRVLPLEASVRPAGPEHRRVEWESPPWRVLSLSQLSVLRV